MSDDENGGNNPWLQLAQMRRERDAALNDATHYLSLLQRFDAAFGTWQQHPAGPEGAYAELQQLCADFVDEAHAFAPDGRAREEAP